MSVAHTQVPLPLHVSFQQRIYTGICNSMKSRHHYFPPVCPAPADIGSRLMLTLNRMRRVYGKWKTAVYICLYVSVRTLIYVWYSMSSPLQSCSDTCHVNQSIKSIAVGMYTIFNLNCGEMEKKTVFMLNLAIHTQCTVYVHINKEIFYINI